MSNLTITISTDQPTKTASTISNTFCFGENSIRIITIDNEPWFSVADVCDVLGYANSRKALADHCRTSGVTKRDISSGGQMRAITFINEGNLYRLIIKSRKPEAEKFESWVCDEVLPSIRKTGSYISTLYEEPETISQDQLKYIEGQIRLIAGWFHMDKATNWLNNLLRFNLNVTQISQIRADDYLKAQAILENAYQQGREYLKIRIEIEEEILKNYLCQGIPFTPTLSKKFFKQFGQRLPNRPNWKQIATQLEVHQ